MKKIFALITVVVTLLTAFGTAYTDGVQLLLTIPYADVNNDGKNDYTAEVGMLDKSYVYDYIIYNAETVTDEKQTLAYQAEAGKSYFYRVSNTDDNDAVTYGSYVTVNSDSAVEVTKENMRVGDGYDKDTVITDFSENSYDNADILLNINQDGHLLLDSGDEYTLYPLRTWFPAEGLLNSEIIIPDYHAVVYELEGENVIAVDENAQSDSSKHSIKLKAQNRGTAVVVVTYDAVINEKAMGGSFMSAIKKENAGVFVVSVDSDGVSGIGMTANEGKNTTDKKLSGDMLDSELDIIYYYGDGGAEYSFAPPEGTDIGIMHPDMTGKIPGYSGSFETLEATDGIVTLAGLCEGSHIIRASKGGNVGYKILKVKKASYQILVGGEAAESVKPGDEVTLVFDRIYHPINKMPGVYNFTAKLSYTMPDGAYAEGDEGQYDFATNKEAQKIVFTVPASYEGESFTIDGGCVVTGMWGCAAGSHRGITYEKGKPDGLDVSEIIASFCILPDIVIPVEQSNIKTVSVSAYAYTARGDSDGIILDNYSVTLPKESAAVEFVKKAFEEKGIQIDISESGYISSIDGLGSGAGFEGWYMAYNNDDYNNMGLGSVEIKNSDSIRFDYSMNTDTKTDDIGNGWYGNPVITSIKAGNTTLSMVKTVSSDDFCVSYNYSDGKAVEGDGSEENPYILNITAHKLPAVDEIELVTTLNKNYQKIGSKETQEENTLLIYVSSLGGRYVSYYKIVADVIKDDDNGSGGGSNTEQTVSVTFRLIGATESEDSVDLSLGEKGYYGSEYKTWVKTKRYSMPKNSTVLDLVIKATDDAGISCDYSKGYISAVTAPSVCGGYELTELGNGSYSGWMFTVNGKHGMTAINETILRNSDTVIVHYMNDYRYEQSDSMFGAQDGNGEFFDRWLKAVDKVEGNNTTGSGSLSGQGSSKQEKKEEEKADEEKTVEETTESVSKSFADVPLDSWFWESVGYAVKKGIMAGIDEESFAPGKSMTRAMFVAVLYRLEKEPESGVSSYKDVPADAYYANAVAWASENEIVSGLSEDEFAPDGDITREQIAAIIYRYAVYKELSENAEEVAEFADIDAVSAWATDAVSFVSSKKIMVGDDNGAFNAKKNATRAECARIFMILDGIIGENV